AECEGRGSAVGPDATAAARAGLCRAWQAGQGADHGRRMDAVAFQALVDAAGGADNIAAYCQDVAAGSNADAHRQNPASPPSVSPPSSGPPAHRRPPARPPPPPPPPPPPRPRPPAPALEGTDRADPRPPPADASSGADSGRHGWPSTPTSIGPRTTNRTWTSSRAWPTLQ